MRAATTGPHFYGGRNGLGNRTEPSPYSANVSPFTTWTPRWRLGGCRGLLVNQRQAQSERGAHLWRALDFDRPLVVFDHFLRDVETQASAALAVFGREVGVENFREQLRRNPVARIFHPDVRVKIFPNAHDRNRAF